MKKFITMAVSLILCFNTTISAFAAIPEGWREMTEEEIESISGDFIEPERNTEKTATDEMYAALYAPVRGDIDTIPDVDIAEDYLGGNYLNYSVERYINPRYVNIDRLYNCTDVLMYTGHGNYDRVVISPSAESDKTDDNCTGVYMGSKSIVDKTYNAKLVGILKRNMSACKFVLFACCEAAKTNSNITKSVVENGAKSAIGWKVKVGSPDLHKWERRFFENVSSRASTIYNAAKEANTLNGFAFREDIIQNVFYGDKDLKLSNNKSRSTEETTKNGLIQIDKNLNIDCSNKNITDLTNYLEENVEGFDSNLFKVKVIHNSIPGENYYTILYGMEIGEFQTPYEVIVFVEDDNIEYSATFDKSDIENLMITPIAFEEDTSLESKIEAAKKEARKEVPDDVIVEEQIVKKVLNEDLVPMLFVKTSCIDEYGGVFVLYYECSLDEKQ